MSTPAKQADPKVDGEKEKKSTEATPAVEEKKELSVEDGQSADYTALRGLTGRRAAAEHLPHWPRGAVDRGPLYEPGAANSDAPAQEAHAGGGQEGH